MKKLITLLVILSFAFIAKSQNNTVEFELIRKSGFTVSSAHKAVLGQNISHENLNKCIEHQRYAILLFNENKIQQAVYHSAYARRMAFEIIQANKMQVNDAYKFTQSELEIIISSPINADLDKNLTLEIKDSQTYKVAELEGIHL